MPGFVATDLDGSSAGGGVGSGVGPEASLPWMPHGVERKKQEGLLTI